MSQVEIALCGVPWLSVFVTFPLFLMMMKAWRMAGFDFHYRRLCVTEPELGCRARAGREGAVVTLLLPWLVPPDPCSVLSQLGSWLDGEAAARLQEMGTEDWSPDSCQGSTEHFTEFLTQATVCLEGLFCNRHPLGLERAFWAELGVPDLLSHTAVFNLSIVGTLGSPAPMRG